MIAVASGACSHFFWVVAFSVGLAAGTLKAQEGAGQTNLY
jgi:hypothetical protein